MLVGIALKLKSIIGVVVISDLVFTLPLSVQFLTLLSCSGIIITSPFLKTGLRPYQV